LLDIYDRHTLHECIDDVSSELEIRAIANAQYIRYSADDVIHENLFKDYYHSMCVIESPLDTVHYQRAACHCQQHQFRKEGSYQRI
jgi:hypothetical protein